VFDVVEFRGRLHVVDPVVDSVAVCARHVPGADRVARDVPTVWVSRLIGSEEFGTDVYGAPKNSSGVTHCVDCVIRLAEMQLGGGV
jgi:hypothetical protein